MLGVLFLNNRVKPKEKSNFSCLGRKSCTSFYKKFECFSFCIILFIYYFIMCAGIMFFLVY